MPAARTAPTYTPVGLWPIKNLQLLSCLELGLCEHTEHALFFHEAVHEGRVQLVVRHVEERDHSLHEHGW